MNKIKFSILIFTGLMLFFLLICFFLKFDLVTKGFIYSDDYTSYVVIDEKTHNYLNSKSLDYVCVNYNQEKAYAKISYSRYYDDFFIYQIYLPPNFLSGSEFFESSIIFDQVNTYSFLAYNL